MIQTPRKVVALDPQSSEGRAAAAALGEVLADVLVAVQARRAAGVGTHPPTGPSTPTTPTGPKPTGNPRGVRTRQAAKRTA